MTSLERVLTTIGQKEPDRVPYFLLLTMHGAKELKISIKDYFSKGENVYEGQVKLREKFGHDCYYTFFYAPMEVEAFGADVIYYDDGPPNAGAPFLRAENILTLKTPKIEESKPLREVLKATTLLKEKDGDEVPIIGVVISPFSLPVMQMGFDKYIDLIYSDEKLFNKLMQVNEEFCVNWANAQLEAGATAICYFDPISSTSMIPRELYLKTGFEVAKRTIAKIKGPTATHFASGNSLGILKDVAKTGTALAGVSTFEDLGKLKKEADKKLTLFGNLNAIEMRRWSKEDTEKAVKDAIAKAGKGGGFILSDNHGEIPFQVPDDVLFAVKEAIEKWGKYPLSWID